MDFFRGLEIGRSEPARAAHGAVVAGLAARIDGALLFILEEFDEFRDRGFFNAKAFLAGVRSDWQTTIQRLPAKSLLRTFAIHAGERSQPR